MVRRKTKSFIDSDEEEEKPPPRCDDPDIFDPEASEPESEPLGEDEYEVEKILRHDYRTAERKYYYFVRWKGWSAEHDQWVSEENMGCPDLIKAYKAQKAKQFSTCAESDIEDFIAEDGEDNEDVKDEHLKKKRRKRRKERSPSPSTSSAAAVNYKKAKNVRSARDEKGGTGDGDKKRDKMLGELRERRRVKREREATLVTTPKVEKEEQQSPEPTAEHIPMGAQEDQQPQSQQLQPEEEVEEQGHAAIASSPIAADDAGSCGAGGQQMPTDGANRRSPSDGSHSVSPLAFTVGGSDLEQMVIGSVNDKTPSTPHRDEEQQQQQQAEEAQRDSPQQHKQQMQHQQDKANAGGGGSAVADVVEHRHVRQCVDDNDKPKERSEEAQQLQDEEEAEMNAQQPKGEGKKERTKRQKQQQQQEEERRAAVKVVEDSVGETGKKRKRVERAAESVEETENDTQDEEESSSRGGEEREDSVAKKRNEEGQRPPQHHIEVKRGPVQKKGRRGTGAGRGVSVKDGVAKEPKSSIPKDVWRDYLGTEWMDIDSIEMEDVDESHYEPMMPLDPDNPEEVDCWVKQLYDIEDNGLSRGWEVESVVGVSAKDADGTRNCFVKFVGFKSPQQIPLAVVQEKAPEAFIQWSTWQDGMDNLDKCGVYWADKLRQPPEWMCRRSLVAFAAWKESKMNHPNGSGNNNTTSATTNNDNIFCDDIEDAQRQPKCQPYRWKWAPTEEEEGEEEQEEGMEEEQQKAEEEDSDHFDEDGEEDVFGDDPQMEGDKL